MTSHGPRDPKNPMKTRQIARIASGEVATKHDARGEKAKILLQTDAIRVLRWLGEQPLRTITGDAMRAWVNSQQPAWTPGYWKAVRALVQDQLAERMAETSQETKARLLNVSEQLLGACQEVVVSGGDLVVDRRTPEYRRWMELKTIDDAWKQYDRRMADYGEFLKTREGNESYKAPLPMEPRWPRLNEQEAAEMLLLAKNLPYLTTINHTAALGHMKFQAQLTGLAAEKHQHLHLHRVIEQGGDLSEVPEAELVAAMRITSKETGNGP